MTETYWTSVEEQVTRDWIECFSKSENRKGFMWRMAKEGLFPAGVDSENPEVKRLLELQDDKSMSCLW